MWEQVEVGRLLVPARLEYPDDAELLHTAVRQLANIEGRAPWEVALDIAEPEMDIPSFRLQPDTPSGTIPLPSALKAMQGIHDLLKVSAQTVELGTRLLYVGPRSKQVDNFLQRVRIGTTRPGSYIFDARVPVSTPAQLTLDAEWSNELAGRVVTTGLFKAVNAAHAAAASVTRGDAGFGCFDDAVEEGVSANLCAALGNLGGAEKNRPFEIGIAWARSETAELPSRTLSFSHHMVRALVSASSELEKLAKSGHATITGMVETLDWHANEEPRVRVKGELQTRADTFQRSIWIVLSQEDYRRAFAAQETQRPLRVRGELTPARKRLEMRPDPDGFEVL
ncbi:hypothetical protein [Nocardia sp. IFM 10818]